MHGVAGVGASRWSKPLVAVGVAVLCVVAATDAIGTPFNQCDNIAGTCIRARQQAAILSLQLSCVAGAFLSLAVGAAWHWGRPIKWRLAWGIVLLSAAVAVFVLAADPIDHLNNRWSGWLNG